jgi:small subunit ribosomal protein S17
MAEEEKDQEEQEEPQAEAEEQAPEAEEPAEEAPAEEEAADEAPAEEAEAPAEPEAEGEGSTEDAAEEADPDASGSEAEEAPGIDDETDWKTRKRLERSRRPSEARPQQSPEDRKSEREQRRGARAVARQRHRQRRRAKKGEPRTGTPRAEHRANPAKVRQGVVVSDGADKTITVRIDIARRHPTYEKIVRRSRTLRAHDEGNEAGAGDVVRVIETRPISRSKRWRLLEVVEKAR